MYNDDEIPPDANIWTFQYTDIAGVKTSVQFKSETWLFALQQFQQFLRGTGFYVDDDSIAINGDKHYNDESPWCGEYFSPDEDVKGCALDINFKAGGTD